MRRLLVATLSLSLGLLACKGLLSGEVEPEYEEEAARDLQKGVDALENNDFTTAQRYFEHVKSSFAFTDEALVAELRLGDVQLATEQYAEARDRFQTFVKIHPTHAMVDYAAFKAAQTYWEEAPDETFLLPPAHEKELGPVRSAVKELSDFIREYPKSQYVPEAQKLLDQAHRRLAQHELYVADFYAKRKRWPAVVTRLKTLLEKYPGLGFEEEALFKLHHAYTELKDTQGAQDALQQVLVKLPGTPAAAKAQKLLGS